MQPLFRTTKGKKIKTEGVIEFKLQFIPSGPAESNSGPIGSQLDKVEAVVNNMQKPSPSAPTDVGTLTTEVDMRVEAIKNEYDVWQLLLDRVNMVVTIVDNIPEVIQTVLPCTSISVSEALFEPDSSLCAHDSVGVLAIS
jgi:hypothetical protein